jgi:hypothetical protein
MPVSVGQKLEPLKEKRGKKRPSPGRGVSLLAFKVHN